MGERDIKTFIISMISGWLAGGNLLTSTRLQYSYNLIIKTICSSNAKFLICLTRLQFLFCMQLHHELQFSSEQSVVFLPLCWWILIAACGYQKNRTSSIEKWQINHPCTKLNNIWFQNAPYFTSTDGFVIDAARGKPYIRMRPMKHICEYITGKW